MCGERDGDESDSTDVELFRDRDGDELFREGTDESSDGNDSIEADGQRTSFSDFCVR